MLALGDLALLMAGLLIALCRTNRDGLIVLSAFAFSSLLAVSLGAYEMGASWHLVHGAIVLLAAFNTRGLRIIYLYAVSALANLLIYIDIWLDNIPYIYSAYSFIIWGVFIAQMVLCNVIRNNGLHRPSCQLRCDIFRGGKA